MILNIQAHLDVLLVAGVLGVSAVFVLVRLVRFFRHRGGCTCGMNPKSCPANRALAAIKEEEPCERQ